jgi:hypothetical protein
MGLIDDLGLDDPLACVWRSTSGRLKPAAWGSPSSVEKDLGRLDELLFKFGHGQTENDDPSLHRLYPFTLSYTEAHPLHVA